MIRLTALAIQAHQLNDLCNGDATLAFGAGLSDPEDPDVSLTDFTGRKRVWVEVGQPDDQPVLGVLAVPEGGLRLPALGQCLGALSRAGEHVALQLDPRCRGLGQDASQPAQGTGVAHAGQQFIADGGDADPTNLHGLPFDWMVVTVARA